MKLRVFMAILRRDARVVRREIVPFLLRTTLQPILLVFVFCYLMPRMSLVANAFTTAMLPGVVGLGLTFAAIQSVSLPMVQDFGFTREIEDRLLAPIPIELVAIEKIVAGMVQGMIAAAVVLIIEWALTPLRLDARSALLLLLMTILGGAACSALGLYLGTAIAPQHIGLMFSVIIAPMIFLGCTYYPWKGLSIMPVLQYVVLINPLVYVSEAMRAAMTPDVPHMPVLAIICALILMTLIFTAIGLRSFRKRAIS